jgi:hypothetical protein
LLRASPAPDARFVDDAREETLRGAGRRLRASKGGVLDAERLRISFVDKSEFLLLIAF